MSTTRLLSLVLTLAMTMVFGLTTSAEEEEKEVKSKESEIVDQLLQNLPDELHNLDSLIVLTDGEATIFKDLQPGAEGESIEYQHVDDNLIFGGSGAPEETPAPTQAPVRTPVMITEPPVQTPVAVTAAPVPMTAPTAEPASNAPRPTLNIPVPVPDIVPAVPQNNAMLGIWVGDTISIFGQVIPVADFDASYKLIVGKETVTYQIGQDAALTFVPAFGDGTVTLTDAAGNSLVLYLNENGAICLDTDASGYPMTLIFRKIL